MAKTGAERARDFRARKKSRERAEGVSDDSPTIDQAAALSRQALATARAKLRDRAGVTVTEAKDASIIAQRAIEIDAKRGQLVDVGTVRRCWSDAMHSASKTLLGLPETLAAELAGVSDEDAVQRILAGQIGAALGELDRSPSTWPVAVGPWESER